MAEHIARRFSREGPKRILALDGGGVRGLISIAFLERIEALLAERYVRHGRYEKAEDFRLSHYFDVVGGTSVGSLIAAHIALGGRMAELRDIFLDRAERIFEPTRVARLTGRYSKALVPVLDARRLRGFIKKQVGERTLGSEDLQTGLVVICKRADTNSVWTLTNNPFHKFYAPKGKRMGNRDYKVADVLRASTAAPTFFSPKRIRIFEKTVGDVDGSFVDGGVSPHNSPALKLFMMAGISGYNFGGGPRDQPKPWALGEDELFMVSVGTGRWEIRDGPRGEGATDAIEALKGTVTDGQELSHALLQWMSNAVRPTQVDRVMGALRNDVIGTGGRRGEPLLSYLRYDASLERGAILNALGRSVTDDEVKGFRDFTDARNPEGVYAIGQHAAEAVRGVDFLSQFDGNLDIPGRAMPEAAE